MIFFPKHLTTHQSRELIEMIIIPKIEDEVEIKERIYRRKQPVVVLLKFLVWSHYALNNLAICPCSIHTKMCVCLRKSVIKVEISLLVRSTNECMIFKCCLVIGFLSFFTKVEGHRAFFKPSTQQKYS